MNEKETEKKGVNEKETERVWGGAKGLAVFSKVSFNYVYKTVLGLHPPR